jgi:cobalt-zinc-cadmium resistance protein CzcA
VIRYLVDFALRNKLLVLAMGTLLFIWGAISFRALPIEAYPDVANIWVQIITQWPGHAAEEVEQLVTVPVEVQMNGLLHLASLRSTSVFGLSVVTMIFDDSADNLLSRQQVVEKLTQLSLPPGLSPVLGPDYSPVGQIMFYTLKSSNPKYDLMELKSLQDWVIQKQLKSVPNVVDVSSFGGITREYQVKVDPNKLVSYGLSIAQVEQALAANNTNAGGSFIEHGQQAFNVRAVGLMQCIEDIGATLLKAQNGTPVRVRDIAVVEQGPKIRLGRIGRAIRRVNGRVVDNNDVVEAIVLMRKGAQPDQVLGPLHDKIEDLNKHVLPRGVEIEAHLDRGDLVHYTTHTVMHNLTEGLILVVVVLFLFLGNVRSALIVAATIPFSLLFAAILLNITNIPANLLSLGALDFGMVVDGSVVMVENMLRHVSRRSGGGEISQKIAAAVHEVQRPVFFARLIIVTAYMPIFTLQRVEGRLFKPMAWTVAFALFGALIFALMIAPVLASFFFRRGIKEWHNPVLEFVTRAYRRTLAWCMAHRWVTIGASYAALGGVIYLAASGAVGSEYLPHLDEGAIWARGTLAPSTGPTEGARVVNEARRMFASFPEVKQVVSQVGRPDDGTDTAGFFNTEYFVDLKLRDEWRPQFHGNKDELIAAMDAQVEKIPGTLWNFSQPIADNMEEAVSGVKGQLAVKIYGDDLKQLEQKADEIQNVMKVIPGVADLGIFRVIGQPNVNFVVDRAKADRYGINVADIQDAVETAVGGKPVTQILQGERRYDLVVRYQEQYRRTTNDISEIRILAPSGERVALGQLCTLKVEDGASMIYHEGNSRYIAIKYSVRGRDLGSTVEQAINNVQKQVKLPEGYRLVWTGEYESQKRANARLAVIVPITILFIFFILYTAFDSMKWAALILLVVSMAPIGGILALYLTGTHFSVSSGIGFLALFGVSVQIGVIMIEYINQLRARGQTIYNAALEGAELRLRPIMMTMLVATLGLLPAAMSHGIGSDSQRPFAIVIVGGLITVLLISVLLMPTMYLLFARPGDRLPPVEEEFVD